MLNYKLNDKFIRIKIVFKMINLQELDLSRNLITGSMHQLSKLNQLIKLNLQHNFLNNVIPNNYFNHLSKLQVLDLIDNVFSGSLHELSKL